MMAGSLDAQSGRKITIKLASLVPESTSWGSALNKMAKEWSQATNGEVEMIVYHGGTVGAESNVLRLLRSNQIQAAVLTSFGMSEISSEVMALSYPFLIKDDAELDAVLQNIRPFLEQQVNKSGFTMLAWSKAGWVRFFSRNPVFVPDDLKKQKMASSEEAPSITNAFKAMGYQMIPVGMNDLMMGLNSGRIDAIFQSPVSAGAFQLFGIAKNMANFNIAPFLGGVVINQAAWRRIPDKYKPALLEIGKNVEKENDNAVQKMEADAITAMKSYGLIVNNVSETQKKLWIDEIGKVRPSLVGKAFDRETLERVEVILKDYRAR
jgi:TRAP-type C4-dicarboxylate transport system substrate-binding protein